MYDERTHRYSYDNQHRLVHYVRTQYHQTQAEGRYLYDALSRRVGKLVWKREREHSAYEQMALSRRPYVTWYGWEGDAGDGADSTEPPSLLQSGAGAVYHSGSDWAGGGWNLHLYPLSPLVEIDPLGLVIFNLYPMRMHRDRILHLVSDLVDISGVYTVVRNGSFVSRLAKKLLTKVIAEDTHWEAGVSQNNNKNSGILDITLGAIRAAPAYPISQDMAKSGNIPDGIWIIG